MTVDGGVYLAQAEDGSATLWRREDYPCAEDALEAHGRLCMDQSAGDGLALCESYRVPIRLVWAEEDREHYEPGWYVWWPEPVEDLIEAWVIG